MKRVFIIISACVALLGCTVEYIEPEVITPVEEQSQVIKTNLSISRTDDYADTKATVKSGWVNGDVIFVFFKNIAAPKYLELRYDGSDWTATAKNSLSSTDLTGAAEKKMTAIYLPYGSTSEVVGRNGGFVLSPQYCGYFLQSELVSYTYDSVLEGSIILTAPAPDVVGDRYIHFDVTGYIDGHFYSLSQDYVKPLTFSGVSADGVVSHEEGSIGDYIIGYIDGDNSIVSFSGLLDASVVGNAVDYEFSIDDETDSILYTRDAGTKTLNTAKYIGIGDISNSSVWKGTEYYDFGISVKWAKCNLGANSPEETGDFFAWGETAPKSNYDYTTYKWYDQDNNQYTKYNKDDGLKTLELCDDAAHAYLGGRWRTPTLTEFQELITAHKYTPLFTSYNGVDCRRFSFGDKYMYLPITGYMEGERWYNKNAAEGEYWTSSTDDSFTPYYWKYFHNEYAYFYHNQTRDWYAIPIRPVCGGAPARHFSSFTINQSELILPIGYTETLIASFTPSTAINKILWTSSDETIARVSSNGTITAIAEGCATITARANDGSGLSQTCTVTVSSEPIQSVVDLGLSIKWATCNLGASSPEESGYYYSWGELETKDDYSWSTYRFKGAYENKFTKYVTNNNYGTKDNKTSLDIEDDVANHILGAGWRMPTQAELNDLLSTSNCNKVVTIINGVRGLKITSKKEGFTNKWVFFPVTGYRSDSSITPYSSNREGHYWTSTLDSPNTYALTLYFDFESESSTGYTSVRYRYYGIPVRPVYDE